MTNKVPLVYYKDGERIVVGEADIDGNKIWATVTDPDLVKCLSATDYGAFAIMPEPAQAEIHNIHEKDTMNTALESFVRKPFTVQAIQVTDENMQALCDQFKLGRVQPKRGTELQYIIVDKEVVPNVFRIHAGFWLTKMGNNIRAYSAKTFSDQFTFGTYEVQRWARLITNADNPKQEAKT